jgi:NAD(P)-dependent dehydrogenase (short-subunit alcohol dehydrogenase family)
VPLRRSGTVDDVSSVVVFLLSDASAYVTGVEHVVDGGSSLS